MGINAVKPNRLANEKSPYLLQHAHNPVDWYPWGDEAFEKAKEEDKPVFLSIGYSTCHWCHVMERESFEDEEVAKILNTHYVSIKVDREERPDIDTIYMSVCQAMTGHGGWPMTIIMTPDKKPFFSGTYFPKNSNRGMPGLTDILLQVAEMWEQDKDRLLAHSDQITESVQESLFAHSPGAISEKALEEAFDYFSRSFDPEFGGFGRAPKFPTPHNLMFLLRYWKKSGNAKALDMVTKTLDAMYLGGIYDHIGFGFARYSTDRRWLVPHFEKMLYDNALLAIAYLEGYQASGDKRYAAIAREIFTYLLRDMTSPEGGFYSAEDADSEGVEGKFYVWSPEEVKAVLGPEAGGKFCAAYDITPSGNFEGKNIPNLIKTGYTRDWADERQKLLAQREKRVHPFKDDKILTGWNGLMIAAMAFGARVLNEDKYAEAAGSAVSFILNNLRRRDGRLLARFRDGSADIPAFAEDYAFLIWGLMELYEATLKDQYLSTALSLNDDMLRLFWDDQGGGFFHYGLDAENLLTRPKEIYDGAIPSANSVAALNLLRLSRITGQTEPADHARSLFRAFGGSVNDTPMGHSFLLTAVYLELTSGIDVTITGEAGAPDTAQLLQAANRPFTPEMVLAFKPAGGQATASVCKDFACLPPTTDPQELVKLL